VKQRSRNCEKLTRCGCARSHECANAHLMHTICADILHTQCCKIQKCASSLYVHTCCIQFANNMHTSCIPLSVFQSCLRQTVIWRYRIVHTHLLQLDSLIKSLDIESELDCMHTICTIFIWVKFGACTLYLSACTLRSDIENTTISA
jgi:hypothetical protein